jgi:GAF domain-containing protein
MTDASPLQPLPLIPLLRAGEGVPDRDVLATWHEALAESIGVELPHDLFALWLYPPGGGADLIGPEALAEDELPVPLPHPRVTDEQANELGAVVARAGYGSVVSLAIRFGSADVGLLLVASLTPNRYGAAERALLGRAADAIAPTLARITQQQAAPRPASGGDLGAELAHAWIEARSPRDFFALASEVLGRSLPHEVFEVLIPGPAPGQQYRLGSHADGPPWADPQLAIGKDRLDLFGLFGGEPTLEVVDAAADSRLPPDLFAEELAAGQRIRSLLGVRVTSAGHLAGHVLVGASRPGLYRSEDLTTLTRLGHILGPKIDGYVLTSQLNVLRKQLVTLRSAPAHLSRVADMLATTAQFAEATRRLAEETRSMLPCERLTLAVRLTDVDRVVLIEPGENKHWADLPLVPISGTPLGRVLNGEAGDVVTETPKVTELIVPLRVAGRTVGALVLAARGFGTIGRSDVAPAQQLADLVAPYVELVRRAVMLPAPVSPSWKRVT